MPTSGDPTGSSPGRAGSTQSPRGGPLPTFVVICGLAPWRPVGPQAITQTGGTWTRPPVTGRELVATGRRTSRGWWVADKAPADLGVVDDSGSDAPGPFGEGPPLFARRRTNASRPVRDRRVTPVTDDFTTMRSSAAVTALLMAWMSVRARYLRTDPAQHAALTVIYGRPTAVVAVCGRAASGHEKFRLGGRDRPVGRTSHLQADGHRQSRRVTARACQRRTMQGDGNGGTAGPLPRAPDALTPWGWRYPVP